MDAVDGWVVAELSVSDWLREAFEAERAPQPPKRPATTARATLPGRIVAGARVTFWWMLGITLLAIALR
ncbi:MAG: hypothetical protein ACK4V1_13510 [Burkholderiaceae bacterium]